MAQAQRIQEAGQGAEERKGAGAQAVAIPLNVRFPPKLAASGRVAAFDPFLPLGLRFC